MDQQIAHNCIVTDYKDLYGSLEIKPHGNLWYEAQNHGHGRLYNEDLERRSLETRFDVRYLSSNGKSKHADPQTDGAPAGTRSHR